MLENNLASVKKELQHAKKDNAALARYINATRKKKEAHKKVEEEAQKKVEEEACKKAEEGQSSKDVRTWKK
jgi:predicted  nucleic acid-binding Zn-ribbon protein